MQAEQPQDAWPRARLAVVVALITAIIGLVASVGADARWLAALGRIIVARGSVPVGVPFAAAPSTHWANTLVLAELVFDALERGLGDRGLIIAQLVAVAAGLALLARDARAEGASAFGTSSALAIAAIGSLASLAIVRSQLFSLVLFPAMVALLRAEHRQPSRRIWLALPLLALWSNLHGAAISGVVVLWIYLALDRARDDRWTTIGGGIGALVALCVTPAGIRTVDYYHGLVTNVAASRGVALWTPLGSGPLDALTIVAALLLAVRLRRRRPPAWELVTLVVLAALTVKAGRDGVWLLFFLVAPAAHTTRAKREWNGLLPIGAAVAVALLAFDVGHRAHEPGASPAIVARALALAHGSPILADAIPAEQVALRRGRIWAGDPLDAFPHPVQGTYLDWLADNGAADRALANQAIRVVLVTRGSAAERSTQADRAFRLVARDRTASIYVRAST
jgi:hypothetical protein